MEQANQVTARKWPLTRVGLTAVWMIGIILLCVFDVSQFNHQRTTLHKVFDLYGDQVHYDGMAILLIKTHIYNYWLEHYPLPMAMPGYPLFVTVIYKLFGLGTKRFLWLWGFQFLLFLLDVFLLYLLGKKLGSRYLGMVLSLCVAAMPFVFMEPFRVMTENLAVPAFLLYLNVLLWLYRDTRSRTRWAATGLMLGVMGLTRPGLTVCGLIPFVMFFRTLGVRAHWRTLLVFLVCCAIPLVPWWIRNLITFHHFFLFDKGEADNTMLAGTFPGFVLGVPLNLQGLDQMALAKQRIAWGFTHEPLKYLMWFTVWRFHYNLDYIYLPLINETTQRLKGIFTIYQRVFVWGSMVVAVLYFVRRWRLGVLSLFLYTNLILLLFLIPFHPEPRFAIYNVVLFAVFLIAALYRLMFPGASAQVDRRTSR